MERVHGVRKVDNGDCTYAVEYTVPHTARGRGGQGRVSVRVKGEHILGSPFTVKIVEGVIPRPEELVFRRKWGGYGSGNGQISSPYGLAVSSSGEVFVSDYSNHRIQVFSVDRQFLRTWGSRGSGNGQFSYPSDVAVSGKGEVFVCEAGNHRIQVFNSNGQFLRTWGSQGSANGQFFGP
jgi:hypothetical protein